MIKFLPSLLCANYINLEKDIRDLDKAKTDIYHIDIMDGHFVPNLGFSLDEIKQMKEITDTPFDVHLMVEKPEEYINKLIALKVEYISFHFEAVKYPLRLIKEIKNKGTKVGVVVNPITKVDLLSYFLDELNYLVVMSIEPGFSGQKFIPSMFEKIENAKEIMNKKKIDIPIEIDGDVNEKTAIISIKKGASMLVCGVTSIFKPNSNLYDEYNKFKKRMLDNL